jgi:two-component system sensor histidine kinase CpxA
MRAPLYLKILGWFLLNLLLLGAGALVFLRAQFHLDLETLLAGQAGAQVEAVGKLIAAELSGKTPPQWDAVLARYDAAYGVQFSIHRPDGQPLAGARGPLPREIGENLQPPPRERPGEGPPPPAPRGRGKALVHTRDPEAYWAFSPIPIPAPRPGAPPHEALLVIRAGSLGAGGLFFDARPWLLAGAAAIALSALFWLPFVRGITRALARMTDATRQIADGNFSITLERRSRDELGSLAESINRMAARLEGFVSGQKRFLGDIAHELCAPLARMQLALGILETRTPNEAAVADVREEADHMGALVSELLAFSKASLAPVIHRAPVQIRPLVERVIQREAVAGRVVDLRIAGDAVALADEHLLERALANLVRNAIRHSTGAIELDARLDGAGVLLLTVADSGPGVPEETLQRIFEPFYRIDPSRSRDTGGVGLGLAIVKTCVEACGGRISCRNRTQGGLEVSIRLDAAS